MAAARVARTRGLSVCRVARSIHRLHLISAPSSRLVYWCEIWSFSLAFNTFTAFLSECLGGLLPPWRAQPVSLVQSRSLFQMFGELCLVDIKVKWVSNTSIYLAAVTNTRKTMLYKNKGDLVSCCFTFHKSKRTQMCGDDTCQQWVEPFPSCLIGVFVDVPANPQFRFLYSSIQQLKPLQVPELPVKVFE